MQIKKVGAEWAERCARFDAQNFAAAAWPLSIWEAELRAPQRRYLMILEPPAPHQSVGRLIALGGITLSPDADLLTLSVAADKRRQGLATQLLHALLAEARTAGTEQVFLEVRKKDTGAQRLYQSFGFEKIHIRPHYYPDDDALIMRLLLSGKYATKLSQN